MNELKTQQKIKQYKNDNQLQIPEEKKFYKVRSNFLLRKGIYNEFLECG